MRIYENGTLVGVLDNALQLTESSSPRLSGLIYDLQENGVDILQAQAEPLEEGQACGTIVINVPYKPKYLHTIVSEIESEGFDVEEIG